MAGKIQLQQAFQKTYELPLFIKSILYPVFTNRVKIYQSPVIETNKANTTELRVIKSVKCYGQIDLDDTTTVKCYEILLNPGVRLEYNKVSIQQYVRKLLTAGQAILVNFQQPEDKNVWRLSLVASDSKIIDDKIEQVKTNAKRYTYLLGPSETCRTASERFAELEALKDISLDNLVKAFSVEKLSKSFFDEYKLHYQAFNSYLINSNFRSSAFGIEKQKDENAAEYKPIRDFVKKTLGRIVFLFFVQKKGWLAASTTKYVDGDLNFIMNLFQKSGANETFYPNHLCKLFFEALNTQRTGDLYTLHFKDGKKEVVCVPFLNGGLFEKEKFDNKTITFPAKLFHNKANDEDPKHRGFLDFLNAFNFTIYEDSPDDHTVAVDPEMLGHIFENLLEDNKDKGAYYTPKEIVHYMCQESLIEYLNTKLNVFEVPLGYTDKGLKTAKPKSKPQQLALTQTDVRDNIKRQEIEDFVKNKNANEFIFQNAKAIDGLLDTVKVCDPAIGSGAFPMGLMQEIFALKMVLHDFVFTTSNELFHLKDYDPQNYRSNVKLNIIQNSIYGVDIEHGAVDIARLRFWLSLIVDEQIPKALPNLDYKIVTGNSLVSKFDDEVIDIDWEVKAGTDATKKLQQQIHSNLEKLFAKQKLFFNYKGDKPKLQNEIRNLKIEVLISQLQLDKYKYSQKSVSNISLFEQTAKQKQQTAETTTQLAGYDKAVKKLEKLKEQPNKPLDFFDWKLNFPEVMNKELNPDNGFDIVIGNPPYINVELMDKDLKELFKLKFDTFFKRSDIFSLFIDYGATTLSKKDGHLSFIIPSIILNNLSYKPLRNKLLDNRWLSQVCYTGNKIFQEATVDTVILLLDKGGVSEILLIDALDFKRPKRSNVELDFFKKFDNVISVSGDDNSNKVFDKVFHTENINVEKHFDVFQGIVTGNNPVYIFDEPEQWKSISIEKELLKTLLHGRDFHKWIIKNTERKILYLNPKSNIDNYPKAKKYIQPFKAELSTRRECINGAIPWFSLQWARDKKLLDTKPKIIIQNTRNERLKPRIVATVDEIGIYGSQGMNFVVPTTNTYSVYFLIAIINSKLIDYLFATKFLNLAIKADYIKQISFPKPSPHVIKQLEEISKKILADKQIKKTDKLESELDNLVYKLYNLTYDEVKLIEPDFALSEADYEKIKL